MRFFFDRCISIRIARIINAFEVMHQIRHHDEDSRFNQQTKDSEWMQVLADDSDPPWIIVSGDGRILKNKVERAVLQGTGLMFFSMSKQWPNMPIPEYAWKFMKIWPEIVESASHSRYRVFEVAGGKALKVNPLS